MDRIGFTRAQTGTAKNAPDCSFCVADFCALVAAPTGAGPPPAGLDGVTAVYAHLLPDSLAILDAGLQALVLQRGVRLVSFCSHPKGAVWDGAQSGSDIFGMLRLYERPPDGGAARGQLKSALGLARRPSAGDRPSVTGT